MINFYVLITIILTTLSNFSYNFPKVKNAQNTSMVSNASILNSKVKSLFKSLNSGGVDDLFIDNYYEGVYFSNLKENIGNNSHGSCSYVALAMLISFYDSYWNDLFIPEEYDVEPISSFITYPSADFSFPSFYAESPGILFEPSNEVNSLSLNEYLLYVSTHSDIYFQSKLISLSQSYFGKEKFENNSNPFGMTFGEMLNFLNYYLYDYRKFNTAQVTINSCNDASSVRFYTINKIKEGIPVILRSESSSLGGHAFIAYDYDALTDEIYVHTGWRDDNSNKTLSHVSLSSTGFIKLTDAISLDVMSPSSFSYNYHSKSGENCSAQNFIFPQDIEIISGNYRDELPTFKWKSVYKEKWVKKYKPYFNFSILNSSSYQIFKIKGLDSKRVTMTEKQWNSTLYSNSSDYYAYVELTSSLYSYFDDYYAKKSFVKPLEYSKLPQIKPNEYGFADAYAIDDETKNNFIKHTASHDFKFETRRFRTGYIHNKYIVMSPIRDGFNEAFIEYRFSNAVTRIDVELAHWRSSSNEWLTSATGEATVQYYWENKWVDKLDLLSSKTALPVDRNSHTFYKLEFDNPVYRVRFYAKSFSTNTNDNNRGRICIGNMAFYQSEYNLPLSGSELDYEPDSWNKTIISQDKNSTTYLKNKTNCYLYAINAQKNPIKNSLEVMNPGAVGGYALDNRNFVGELEILSYIKEDAKELGFVFESIDEDKACPEGCYKVAFVIDNQGQFYDYHFYRQNSDGTWSHKPGNTDVTKYDSSGKIIMDPRKANRYAAYDINYNLFVGFYIVKPLNIYYS